MARTSIANRKEPLRPGDGIAPGALRSRTAREMIYSGDPYHPGLIAEWAADWDEAWRAAALIHRDDRQRLAFLEQTSIRLHQQLRQDEMWAALAALADNLLAHETLEAEQVEEIVREWLR